MKVVIGLPCIAAAVGAPSRLVEIAALHPGEDAMELTLRLDRVERTLGFLDRVHAADEAFQAALAEVLDPIPGALWTVVP